MKSKNSLLSRFFDYFYNGRLEVPLRRVENFESEMRRPDGEEKLRNNSEKQDSQLSHTHKDIVVSRTILNINKLLSFICIFSLISMVIFVFVYPDKPIPDVLQNAFSSTLAWSGSAFANFFQVEKSIKK